MLPNRRKTAGASSTSTTTKTFAGKEELLLKARTLKRAERAEDRRVKAEKHKAAGNAHFRKGEHRDAIAEWEVAIKIQGPTAVYLSNMAQAWLKLKSYDAAEHCARRALSLDPKCAKARFRRGLARKGNLQLAGARVDFLTLLEQDPGSTEAKKELDEISVLMRERNEQDEPETRKPGDAAPSLTDANAELESMSDSSDWNHKGNSLPCRDYNHDGCTRGVECKFSHGPDHRSVRDRLGRNVCVQFLLGQCRLGSCVYSHDKTYLPSGRWWESEWKRSTIRDVSRWAICRRNPTSLPRLFAILDERIAWTPAPAAKKEEANVWKNHTMMLEGFGDATDNLANAAYTSGGRGPVSGRHSEPELDNSDSEENEESVNNRGFGEGEINPEEVCQCDGIPGRSSDDDTSDVNFDTDNLANAANANGGRGPMPPMSGRHSEPEQDNFEDNEEGINNWVSGQFQEESGRVWFYGGPLFS